MDFPVDVYNLPDVVLPHGWTYDLRVDYDFTEVVIHNINGQAPHETQINAHDEIVDITSGQPGDADYFLIPGLYLAVVLPSEQRDGKWYLKELH